MLLLLWGLTAIDRADCRQDVRGAREVVALDALLDVVCLFMLVRLPDKRAEMGVEGGGVRERKRWQ